MKIGSVETDNPVVLAPMAGITDKTFRIIAKSFGVGLVFTEMISAKALSYKNIRTESLLDLAGEAHPIAVQLFGSEPEVMAEAAVRAEAAGADIIDINMGCPVPKVVKNREGSALLETPELAASLVSAMALAARVPISVKIRLGMSKNNIIAVSFAQRMEAAGASLVTVHGRTREQYYSGQADWDLIRQVKEAVRIPVIGSGDIWKPADARRMMDQTGCDGVMIGRGALGNPWLLGQTVQLLAGKTPLPDPSPEERIAGAIHHMHQLVMVKGEAKAIPEMRKHLVWYLKGLPQTAPLKRQLMLCQSEAEAEGLLQDYLKERSFQSQQGG